MGNRSAKNYIRCCRVCDKYYRTTARGSKKCDSCKKNNTYGGKCLNEVKI